VPSASVLSAGEKSLDRRRGQDGRIGARKAERLPLLLPIRAEFPRLPPEKEVSLCGRTDDAPLLSRRSCRRGSRRDSCRHMNKRLVRLSLRFLRHEREFAPSGRGSLCLHGRCETNSFPHHATRLHWHLEFP
jgi:hypothetical protein